MRKSNNLVVITLILIVIVSLFYINLSMKYSNKNIITNTYVINNSLVKSNNSITIKEQDDDEEINLGDNISYCEEYECNDGDSLSGTTCTNYKCNGSDSLSGTTCTHNTYGCLSTCNGPGSGNWNGKCCYGLTSSKTYDATETTYNASCSKCSSEYKRVDGECGKCDFNLSRNKEEVSPGTEWCAIIAANKFCEYSGDERICTTPKTPCVKSTITVTIEGISKPISIPVAEKWKEVKKSSDGKVHVPEIPSQSSMLGADAWYKGSNAGGKPTMEFGVNCKKVEGDPGNNTCDSYYTRGICGTQPIPTYSYCCVDKQFIGVSNEKTSKNTTGGVKWADNVIRNNDCKYYFGNEYTLATNPDGSAVPKSKCSAPEIINRCNSTYQSFKVEPKSTNNCEETVEIDLNEGEKCSDNSNNKVENSFYTINCNRKVKINFDYGDDGVSNTVRELYLGQGFKFGINIETVIECEKTFSGSKLWKSSYKNLLDRIRTIDNNLVKYYENDDELSWKNYVKGDNIKFKDKDVRKRVYQLWNYLDELKKIVNDYNTYEADNYYNETAILDFDYKVNDKLIKLSSQIPNQSTFEKNVVSEGKYTYTYEKTVNLDVEGKIIKGITYPKNIKKNMINNPRIVKLNPKQIYVNAANGSLQYDAKSSYSGGNKIYIDYYTDTPQLITPINITLTGYAGKESDKIANAVTNDKCTLKVKDMEIIYRPIDVSNPFINNTWTPGKNWLNSQFDFRNIIHSNIWSTSGYYAKYENDTWNKSK